eukprot:TRINITY_DN36749_c1_g1_i1.p1 TRINITY_DN36749_c1_g1~~TRINITY_DN36749_c1_g1_i1.p1  ORF type:complete len:101 (-),score=4.05 TRINITY_DN36749_c1_g1_i1:172-474(-)
MYFIYFFENFPSNFNVTKTGYSTSQNPTPASVFLFSFFPWEQILSLHLNPSSSLSLLSERIYQISIIFLESSKTIVFDFKKKTFSKSPLSFLFSCKVRMN